MKITEERKEIEKILTNAPKDIAKNVAVPGSDTPELQPEPIMDVDFSKLKETCESDARVMILNSVKFSLPQDMIKGNDYLTNKIDVDAMSLSGMIYQLRINEIMQKALMEQVNAGMINPRMWEVFGQLSKTIGDLNKQLLQTVEAIKETYKTFKNDIKESRTEALGPQSNGTSGILTTGDGSVVTRGTKELINNVKRIKNAKRQINEADDISDANLVPDK